MVREIVELIGIGAARMNNSVVRKPQEAEIVPAGVVLGRAFQDEPIFRAVISDPADRLALCTALFTANLRHARQFGGIRITGINDNSVNGVLYWVDKPDPELSDDALEAFGYRPVFDSWGEQLETIGQIEQEAVEALGPIRMPWRYLAGVGVDPDFQGRGLGSRLVTWLVTESAAAGLDCALVTDRARNVPLYQRCGFETIATGTATLANVQFWSMITAARPKREDGG